MSRRAGLVFLLQVKGVQKFGTPPVASTEKLPSVRCSSTPDGRVLAAEAARDWGWGEIQEISVGMCRR